MKTLRELLLDVDVAVEEYTSAIARARNPSLLQEEQRRLVAQARVAWLTLNAAHEQLCRSQTGARPQLRVVPSEAAQAV